MDVALRQYLEAGELEPHLFELVVVCIPAGSESSTDLLASRT